MKGELLVFLWQLQNFLTLRSGLALFFAHLAAMTASQRAQTPTPRARSPSPALSFGKGFCQTERRFAMGRPLCQGGKKLRRFQSGANFPFGRTLAVPDAAADADARLGHLAPPPCVSPISDSFRKKKQGGGRLLVALTSEGMES